MILFQRDPNDPKLKHHKLQGDLKDYYSINVTGDWRILYKKFDERTVILIRIGTHSPLYK